LRQPNHGDRPFFRRPRTPDEWRARARIIESQLEGLTIDELLRGIDKHGRPIGGGGRGGYDPNQPRVPAGHSDGGQWTDKPSGGPINDPRVISDAIPDNEWIPGADYAAVGHHYAPRQAWQDLPLRPETRAVFDKAVSGPLPAKVWSRREQRWLRHAYDQRHREYNVAVSELIHNYMRLHRIAPHQMTPAQAEAIVRAIFASSDPRIRRYNYMINVMRRYIRRFGGRGIE
jgi:hypothetical protein